MHAGSAVHGIADEIHFIHFLEKSFWLDSDCLAQRHANAEAFRRPERKVLNSIKVLLVNLEGCIESESQAYVGGELALDFL